MKVVKAINGECQNYVSILFQLNTRLKYKSIIRSRKVKTIKKCRQRLQITDVIVF